MHPGDMFQCCDSSRVVGDLDEEAETLDLHEPPAALNMLFHLLHNTPPEYAPAPRTPDGGAHDGADYVHIRASAPAETAIPFPLLPTLLALVDKYAVAPDIAAVCRSHLAAYAPTYPLRVYGMAVGLGLGALAARTSKFLLHPPLAAYTPDEISVIPTAEAYHRLVLLHEHRIKRLREVLAGEPIFPQNYGECSKHTHKTKARWEDKKKRIISRMEAGERGLMTLTFASFLTLTSSGSHRCRSGNDGRHGRAVRL